MSSSASSHQPTGLSTLIQKFANWRWDRLVEDVIVKCVQQVFPAGSSIEEVGNARRDQRPRQPGLGDGVSRGCDKARELGIVSHSVTHGNCCAPFVKFPVSARRGGDINRTVCNTDRSPRNRLYGMRVAHGTLVVARD